MNEKDIEQQARKALDNSVAELSPDIQNKLYAARQAAMTRRPKPWFQMPLIGFAVAASFSAILVVNYLPDQTAPQLDLTQTNIEDFMILASMDETDLEIAEDLEFAYWLSEQLDNEDETETVSDGDVRNG